MSLPTTDEPVVSQALVKAWQKGCEDSSRARLAYAGLERRRARARTPVLAASRWLLVGMLTAIGSLYAANGAPLRRLGIGVEVAASVASASAPLPGSLRSKALPAVTTPTPLALDSGHPLTLAAPAVSASTAAPASGVAPVPHASATIALPVERQADDSSAPEQWQRAARGLRDGDFTMADEALRELVAQTFGSEREAAQLAHAQLLLSHGREQEALSTLRLLQQSAVSGSVRRKAGEILMHQPRNSSSDRSVGERPAANGP